MYTLPSGKTYPTAGSFVVPPTSTLRVGHSMLWLLSLTFDLLFFSARLVFLNYLSFSRFLSPFHFLALLPFCLYLTSRKPPESSFPRPQLRLITIFASYCNFHFKKDPFIFVLFCLKGLITVIAVPVCEKFGSPPLLRDPLFKSRLRGKPDNPGCGFCSYQN